ncbi:MAG: hypothetical protein JWQ39_932 [Glaciihabitans sp.]|nr:hypothetical protein [Glaciihabitans sp.]
MSNDGTFVTSGPGRDGCPRLCHRRAAAARRSPHRTRAAAPRRTPSARPFVVGVPFMKATRTTDRSALPDRHHPGTLNADPGTLTRTPGTLNQHPFLPPLLPPNVSIRKTLSADG